MKSTHWAYINLLFLSLFFVIRALVMNVNVFYSLIILIEAVVVIAILVKLGLRRNPDKKKLLLSAMHISGILFIIFFVGHLLTVSALSIYHYNTINVFEANGTQIPVADRINGAWILNVEEFDINAEEREVLESNYNKMSPCFYDEGICYIELGGFLNNSGGYYYKIDNNAGTPKALGFHRISDIKRIIGGWYYYN